ncbi:MAG: serine/threonine protein kinase [Planctomycetes bacterium]|nr:serine/threonine protein kinase [Planctomycetota bacterium]
MPAPNEPQEPREPDAKDRSEQLRRLLEACIERIALDGPGAEDAVLAQHPEDARLVRERLAKLRQAGLLDTAGSTTDGIPQRLGEFRLIRRLGAGGMGVVYLAEQESLRREVALKLVRPEQLLFPGARERFRREVETIARLSDPGIVPIYQVGEDQGVPFFAMAVVPGLTLAELLHELQELPDTALEGRSAATAIAARRGENLPERLPELFLGSWSQFAARLVRAMADAVAHAHERGVVHRDLKPSNAMVTLDGRVVLLDFGLAAAQGTERITRSGAAIGTLHYMAPEQLAGAAVDERTDVHALGVTLHELLARRPAFDGETAESVRSAILAGAAPAIRTINRSVPRDLETICRRAMDLEPARRYPTADALAADLQRFLEHRPIEARRAGPWLRTRRWMRRHPAIAAALASVPLLALTAAVVVDRVRLEFSSELVTARRESARVESLAESTLRNALAAIDRLRAHGRAPVLARTPGLDDLRRQQLEEAVALLHSLREQHEDRRDIRRGYAAGLSELAQLCRVLGESGRAGSLLDAAERELSALLAIEPSDGLVAELAAVQVVRGTVRRELGRLDEARAAWTAAIAALEPLAAAPGASPELLQTLSAALGNRGVAAHAERELAAAEADLRRALAIDERVLSVKEPDGLRLGQLRIRANLCTLLLAQGRAADALVAANELIDAATRLHDADPGNPELRRELARARAAFAKVLGALGRNDEAEREIAASLALFARLSSEFADRVEYCWEHDMAEFAAARTALERGDEAAAEAHLRRAVSLHESFLERAPARAETRRELATMLGMLADLRERAPDGIAEAEALLARALQLYEALLASPQTEAIDRVQHALVLYNRAVSRRRRAEFAGMREDCAACAPVLAELWRAAGAAENAPFAPQPTTVFQAHRMLAEGHAEANDPAAAVAALAALVELGLVTREQLVALGDALHLATRRDFESLLSHKDLRE